MKSLRRRILSVFLIFTLCLLCVGTITPVKATSIESPYDIFIRYMRPDIDDCEVATAEALNIVVGSDFDPADLKEGITFDEEYVDVRYLDEQSGFDIMRSRPRVANAPISSSVTSRSMIRRKMRSQRLPMRSPRARIH